MAIKKYSSGQWVDTPYRKYETATDTITTLPKTIIGDGQNISAYTIKGNMSQSGTPTPSDPIYPSECGEKTINMCNIVQSTQLNANAGGYGTYISNNSLSVYATGTNNASGIYCQALPVATISGRTYTISFTPNCDNDNGLIIELGSVQKYVVFTNSERTSVKITASTNNRLVAFYGGNNIEKTITLSNIQVEEGDVAHDYEPYGQYKLPITLGGNNYPVYLSEPIRNIGTYVDSVPSTGTASRIIKKLVLTGEETDWNYESPYSRFGIPVADMYARGTRLETVVCSHYPCIDDGRAIGNVPDNSIYVGTDITNKLWIKTSSYTSTTAFKSYLAQQFSSGTPVTVWYVLTTPTTESFTAPTLPTSGTAETFDVDTALKPSEVSLTYHGWHEHSDTKYTT